MRALMLTHAEACYGSNYLWNGLNIVLGEGNVYDYSEKPGYHGKPHNNVDIPEQNIFNGSVSITPWMPAYKEHGIDTKGIIFLLKNDFFDFIVVESGRLHAMRRWDEIKDYRGRAKVILHDGEDFSTPNTDAIQSIKPDVYLKRELLKSFPNGFTENGMLVLPFPFSCPDQLVPTTDRTEFDYNVCFCCGNTYPLRGEMALALHELPGVFVANNGGTNFIDLLPFFDYIEMLRRSRFGVSVRGFGWDTCRYWETAVNTGLIADELGIHIPNPFQNGKNCLVYDNIECAVDISQFVSVGHYSDIRQAGMTHARKHHLNSARVKWLLEQITN